MFHEVNTNKYITGEITEAESVPLTFLATDRGGSRICIEGGCGQLLRGSAQLGGSGGMVPREILKY